MTNEKQREFDEKQFWFIVEDYDARTTRMDVVMMDSEPDEREKSEGSWIHAINYSAFTQSQAIIEQQAARIKELEADVESWKKRNGENALVADDLKSKLSSADG